MSGYTFHCPHCAARLRLSDQRLIGRSFDCPDCRRLLEIRGDGRSGVQAVQVGPPADAVSPSPVAATRAAGPEWFAALTSPLGLAWTVAAALAVALGVWVLILPDSRRHSPKQSQTGRAAVDEGARPAKSADQGPEDAEPPAVHGRLKSLHATLRTVHQGDQFPAGAVGHPALSEPSRFSWLAGMAAAADPSGPPPAWDRAWNDPRNDRFVRRRQEGFLNPLIKVEAGRDRYPASHFVGIEGVGTDAETLPPDHPRAGVFHRDRPTQHQEIHGGLSNTLLIAGVDRDLGAWAAAGRSTVRAFTREPYINGPDGFGTGQAEGMYVAMADGSVRFLSHQTDPDLILRLATKADETASTDSQDSGRQHTETQAPPVPAAATVTHGEDADDESRQRSPQHGNPFAAAEFIEDIAAGEDVPIEPLLVPEDHTARLTAALAQPITRFQQTDPVAVRDLLLLIEEMAAINLDTTQWPPEMQARLEQKLTLSLTETTVGEILRQVLAQVGLQYAVQEDGIGVSVHAVDGP